MNQLWVRISLTFVAILVFLILLPSGIYIAINADQIDFESVEPPMGQVEPPDFLAESGFSQLLVRIPNLDPVFRVLRVLISITLLGILVGVISSRGLTAPLNNLARAANAVGSQDLSQRIPVKGSSEVQEVAVAFNAMTEALEEADRLRNNMLADIAHELRTPLTVIQGNLRAILDDVFDLDKVEVARLYDQTRQLSRLVDDLHDLSLLEANQFSLNISEQNLIEVVRDVAAIYQPIFDDQGITLTLDLPERVSPVMGDCARITQCLNNLLNNALYHTVKGGMVAVCLAEENSQVSLEVRDNGGGIAPEHLPYVFDRFYRADADRNRRTGGSGLGLAITKALVEAHGGEIKASSPGQNQGASFTISFPC